MRWSVLSEAEQPESVIGYIASFFGMATISDKAFPLLSKAWKQYGKPVKILGKGSKGVAVLLADGTVLKFTEDVSEYNASHRLVGHKFNDVVEIYDAKQIKGTDLFVIHQERLEPAPDRLADALTDIAWAHAAKKITDPRESVEELVQALLASELKPVKMLAQGLEDLMGLSIYFIDVHGGNIGQRRGRLVLFDIGRSVSPAAVRDFLERNVLRDSRLVHSLDELVKLLEQVPQDAGGEDGDAGFNDGSDADPEREYRDDDIRSALEDAVEDLANASAAQAWSTPDDQTMADLDVSEEGIWIRSDFGTWTAINGDLVYSEEPMASHNPSTTPPEGFERSNKGGDIPIVEEGVSVEHAVNSVIRKNNDYTLDEVERVAKQVYKRGEAYVSVSGEAEIWYLPKPEVGE